MKTNSMQVAETILSQLGGRKAIIMIGMKSMMGGVDFLSFGWKCRGSRNKANKAVITLTPSDTYTVRFCTVRGADVVERGEFDDVYADQLAPLFTRETGLDLSL